MPALFDPQSLGPVQVLEHQVPFTQLLDAHSPSAEHGSPSFLVPDPEVPELADVPELELPELAALPELPPAVPAHSVAQFASTQESVVFATEF